MNYLHIFLIPHNQLRNSFGVDSPIVVSPSNPDMSDKPVMDILWEVEPVNGEFLSKYKNIIRWHCILGNNIKEGVSWIRTTGGKIKILEEKSVVAQLDLYTYTNYESIDNINRMLRGIVDDVWAWSVLQVWERIIIGIPDMAFRLTSFNSVTAWKQLEDM